MFKTFATAALAVSFAGAAMAEDKFKSAELLAQPKEGQIGYINASVAMASVMVSPNQNRCILSWVDKSRPSGYSDVLATMQKYGDYHPAAVIAAVLEKQCGSFELAGR